MRNAELHGICEHVQDTLTGIFVTRDSLPTRTLLNITSAAEFKLVWIAYGKHTDECPKYIEVPLISIGKASTQVHSTACEVTQLMRVDAGDSASSIQERPFHNPFKLMTVEFL